MALPRVKFLSNPRRMHSEGEDEEKGEQGVTKGSYLLLNNLLLPLPLPPHTRRAPTGLPGAALSGHPPPIVHVNRPNSVIFKKSGQKVW